MSDIFFILKYSFGYYMCPIKNFAKLVLKALDKAINFLELNVPLYALVPIFCISAIFSFGIITSFIGNSEDHFPMLRNIVGPIAIIFSLFSFFALLRAIFRKKGKKTKKKLPTNFPSRS